MNNAAVGDIHRSGRRTADVRILIELKDDNNVNHVVAVYQRWGAVGGTRYFTPRLDQSANLAGGAPRARGRK